MLFLGYNREKTRLIALIEQQGWAATHADQVIDDFSGYDLVVSFGYRHILKPAALQTARRPILNLHIGYLPWNRGAHPLFWAAYDRTPFGVTIHEIDSGVDTGPICFQKQVEINIDSDSFLSAHQKLTQELEALFELYLLDILHGNYLARPQSDYGSVKRVRDLPAGFLWSEKIGPTIRKLKQAPSE
jgi:methionyl-tRNA formyltransferase